MPVPWGNCNLCNLMDAFSYGFNGPHVFFHSYIRLMTRCEINIIIKSIFFSTRFGGDSLTTCEVILSSLLRAVHSGVRKNIWNHIIIVRTKVVLERTSSQVMPLWKDSCAGYAPLQPFIKNIEKTQVTNL